MSNPYIASPYVADTNPYQLPDPQDWAIDQERRREIEAVYRFGEYTAFVLMWRIQDFEAGLVARCPVCFVSQGRVAEVFGQTSDSRCPACYGTTFEGGYRAIIIRPALWNVSETTQEHRPRGETFRAKGRLQTTHDFMPRTDDYAFRADGTRWQISAFGADYLRTGFEPAHATRSGLAWTMPEVTQEDPTSPAFLLPPSPAVLADALDPPQPRTPLDFSAIEDIRGPLQ